LISQLTDIEYQLLRITKIPKTDDEITEDLEQISLDLLIAIMKFITDAVRYFGRDFFGFAQCPIELIAVNVLKSLTDAKKPFDESRSSLNEAIKRYDQAIIDVIASLNISKALALWLID